MNVAALCFLLSGLLCHSVYGLLDHCSICESKRCTSDEKLSCSCGGVEVHVNSNGQEYGKGEVSLGFVVDSTGTMSSEIYQIKNYISQIVKNNNGLFDKFVLSEFNDPFTLNVLDTTSFTDVQNWMKDLMAHGGGDCPETALQGIRAVVNKASKGSIILLFTDASAKDVAEHKEPLKNELKTKKITLIVVATGNLCQTDGQVYKEIATATNGTVYHAEKSDVNFIIKYIRQVMPYGISFIKGMPKTLDDLKKVSSGTCSCVSNYYNVKCIPPPSTTTTTNNRPTTTTAKPSTTTTTNKRPTTTTAIPSTTTTKKPTTITAIPTTTTTKTSTTTKTRPTTTTKTSITTTARPTTTTKTSTTTTTKPTTTTKRSTTATARPTTTTTKYSITTTARPTTTPTIRFVTTTTIDTQTKCLPGQHKKKVCKCLLAVPTTSTSRQGSLIFVIDDTGSMRNVIDNIKKHIRDIVKSNSRFRNYVIATFGDPYVPNAKKSTSVDKILKVLRKVKAKKGGDCPENAFHGIEEAAKLADDSSVLFLFTDASAKDRQKLDDTQRSLKSRNIRVITIITGGLCGHSRRFWNRRKNGYQQEFHSLSKYTGGTVVNVHENNMPFVLRYIKEASEGILKFHDFPGTGKRLQQLFKKSGRRRKCAKCRYVYKCKRIKRIGHQKKFNFFGKIRSHKFGRKRKFKFGKGRSRIHHHRHDFSRKKTYSDRLHHGKHIGLRG